MEILKMLPPLYFHTGSPPPPIGITGHSQDQSICFRFRAGPNHVTNGNRDVQINTIRASAVTALRPATLTYGSHSNGT